jgi:hypothetical protein
MEGTRHSEAYDEQVCAHHTVGDDAFCRGDEQGD